MQNLAHTKKILIPQLNGLRGKSLRRAILELLNGNCIAYPTEAVYGLGCDPRNPVAVGKLNALKRCVNPKRFILIGCCFKQLQEFADFSTLTAKQLHNLQQSWPGAVTWLVPRQPTTPEWITQGSDMVAVRIPDHPLARQLTYSLGSAITSTSANLHGHSPCSSWQSTLAEFTNQSIFILPGATMGYPTPSQIRNSLTGDVLRE